MKFILISFFTLIAISTITIYIILYNYDLNGLKPHIYKLVESNTGRELIIGGDIHLQVSLAPRVIIKDIALKNAQWGSNQNMIQAKRLKLQVALFPLLSKKIIVKQLVISEPDILLEVGHDEKTNFEFTKQSIVVVEKLKEKRNWPVFGTKKIIIENGRFTYNNLKSKETYFGEIKRLTVRGKNIIDPVNLELRGLFNDQVISAEGTIGPIPALSDPAKKFLFNILVKTGGNSLYLDGSILDITSIHGIIFNFQSMIKNPLAIERLINQPFPIDEPFETSGQVIANEPNHLKIPKFSFTSPNIAFDSSIEINIKEKRPHIKAVISAEKLNLISLMPDASQDENIMLSGKTEPEKSRLFSDDSLPVNSFDIIDADVQLKASSVLLPKAAFNNLSANIKVKEGRLFVDNFKADMGSGALDGYFYLYSKNDIWSVDTAMKVEHLPLELLVPSKKVTDTLEGSIDMLFSFTGQGKSIAEIMASLDGNLGLSMCDGIIATKHLDLLGADFSTSLVKAINPFTKKTDYTEVNCFVCIMDIKQGIAQTKTLVLDTGRTLTIGRGKVDFKTEKLDISLKPVPKEGLGIDKIGKISISLGELSKPVKISGTLSKPFLAIDLTQTAITLTKVAGGVALLGPAGAMLALVTGRIGDDNPCLAAVEAVKLGNKEEGLNYEQKQGFIRKTTTSITDRLNKLF